MLAFSRNRGGRREPIDLNLCVAETQQMLTRLLGTGTLEVHLDPRLPAIEADRSQVDQVLVNLVVNARDAGPPGSTVRVSTASVRVRPRDDDDPRLPGRYACLTVEDEGRGMDAETRERAFEPFFTTKGDRGTGLGLATVKRVVESHGGFVRLNSERGRGTRFSVFFYADENLSAEDASTYWTTPPQEGVESVLVVDDEPAIRRGLQRSLERYGYAVVGAGDAGDALGAAEQHDFDLLITDIRLPDLSGRDLADRIRQRSPDTRVLYVTGWAGTDLPDGGQLVVKPFTPTSLLKAVRQVLDTP